MKKNALLLAATSLLVIPCLQGCDLIDKIKDKLNEGKVIEVTDLESLREITNDTNSRLEADIEIFAQEDLHYYQRELKNANIDGNGHSITVVGNDGKVCEGMFSLFGEVTECTFKNLTLNFDMKLVHDNLSSNGGFAKSLTNSVLYNVDVNYNDGMSVKGIGGYKHGGIAGFAEGCYISKCDVTGDFEFCDQMAGGLFGGVFQSELEYNTFNGSISYTYGSGDEYFDYEGTDKEYRGAVGGLVGFVNSRCNIIGNQVTLKGFKTNLIKDTWRKIRLEAGGMVGYTFGDLIDNKVSYVGECPLTNQIASGEICHFGLFAGRAVENADLKNVLIDTTELVKFTNSTDNEILANVGSYAGAAKLENDYLLEGDAFRKVTTFDMHPLYEKGLDVEREVDYNRYHDCKLKFTVKDINGEDKVIYLKFDLLVNNNSFNLDLTFEDTWAHVQGCTQEYNLGNVRTDDRGVAYFNLKGCSKSINESYSYVLRVESQITLDRIENRLKYLNLNFDVDVTRGFIGLQNEENNLIKITRNVNDIDFEDHGLEIIGEPKVNRWSKTSTTLNINDEHASSFEEALEKIEDYKISLEQ